MVLLCWFRQRLLWVGERVSVFKRDQVGWGAQDCITQCQICPEGVWHGFVCLPSLFPLPALSILHFSTLLKEGPSSQIMCLVCPSDNSFFAIACVCVCVCVGNAEVIAEDSVREFPQFRLQPHSVIRQLYLCVCAPSHTLPEYRKEQ